MKKNIYKIKGYAHFDNKIHWSKVRHLVENPKWVAKHGFYPFIHYTQEIRRFNKESGRKPPKKREILYSSHIDRYIYSWYSYMLNSHYNERAISDGINKCVIAYRNNKRGQCNIHYAKEVFDFIRDQTQAYIIVGDFTSFFDRLDHVYLKERLCELLKVDRLPNDYYAVYKNITKYAYFELDDLKNMTGLNHRKLNEQDKVLELETFRNSKKQHLKKNEESYGIPQGSAISAVLSNVYMLDFDKKVNDYITSRCGFYRRYCDDFVVVMPQCELSELNRTWEYVMGVIDSINKLDIQTKKTKVYEYSNRNIRSCNSEFFHGLSDDKDVFDYLGFTFDGKRVSVRERTISKYYYRMYKRADAIVRCKGKTKNGKLIPKDTIYKKYTHFGAKPCRPNHRGNFLTYIDRAQTVFGPDEAIDIDTRRHWSKLHKRLNGVFKRANREHVN